MSTLVVYFTRTGNSEKIAKKITQKINCDIEEIVDKKKWSGFVGFFTGGFSALTGKNTNINTSIKKPQDYEKIVIVSPVWASNMPPAIREYIKKNKSEFNFIYFVLTYNSGGDKEAAQKMRELAGEPSAVVSFSKKERDNEIEEQKINDFIKKINN